MYGDGMKRGPSAGDLADAFEAELNTGHLDPALQQAVNKMLGGRELVEIDRPMTNSPILPPGASMRAENIETLEDALATLQGIIDGKR